MAKVWDGGPKSLANRGKAGAAKPEKGESEALQKMKEAIQRKASNASGGGGAPNLEDGAILTCDKGSSPSPLSVPGHNISPTGKMQANKDDCAVGKNISPFGVCNITKKPCFPSIVGTWMSTNSKSSVGGSDSITTGSLLVCAKGGLITPSTSGMGMASPISSNLKSDALNPLAFGLSKLYQKGQPKHDVDLYGKTSEELEALRDNPETDSAMKNKAKTELKIKGDANMQKRAEKKGKGQTSKQDRKDKKNKNKQKKEERKKKYQYVTPPKSGEQKVVDLRQPGVEVDKDALIVGGIVVGIIIAAIVLTPATGGSSGYAAAVIVVAIASGGLKNV